MKKLFAIVAVLVVLSVLCLCVGCGVEHTNADFLRIHIRADSNAASDQQVKYAVRDAVVEYLTPYLCNVTSKRQALEVVKSHLRGIEQAADAVLQEGSFEYRCTASICTEEFPDRSYNGVLLPSGVYDALILSLGSGKGDNWWCVVYPPLCFVAEGGGKIQYRSLLIELVNSWLENYNASQK